MSQEAPTIYMPKLAIPGPARRQQLVEATVRILIRGGVSEVSHRTVSDEAGLPITATTYYFSTLDALLAETFRALFEAFISKPEINVTLAREASQDPVAVVVDGFLDVVTRRESTSRVLWELLLTASRRADLKGFPHIYWAAQIDLLSQQLSVTTESARAIIALLDGYMLSFLTTRFRPSREHLLALIRGLLATTNEGEPATDNAAPGSPNSAL